jgi:hypothetical protein
MPSSEDPVPLVVRLIDAHFVIRGEDMDVQRSKDIQAAVLARPLDAAFLLHVGAKLIEVTKTKLAEVVQKDQLTLDDWVTIRMIGGRVFFLFRNHTPFKGLFPDFFKAKYEFRGILKQAVDKTDPQLILDQAQWIGEIFPYDFEIDFHLPEKTRTEGPFWKKRRITLTPQEYKKAFLAAMGYP